MNKVDSFLVKDEDIVLTGSEKQIAWAKTIRSQKIAEYNNTITQLTKSFSETKLAGMKELNNEQHNELQEIFNNNSAEFWINNRYDALITKVVKKFIDKEKQEKIYNFKFEHKNSEEINKMFNEEKFLFNTICFNLMIKNNYISNFEEYYK